MQGASSANWYYWPRQCVAAAVDLKNTALTSLSPFKSHLSHTDVILDVGHVTVGPTVCCDSRRSKKTQLTQTLSPFKTHPTHIDVIFPVLISVVFLGSRICLALPLILPPLTWRLMTSKEQLFVRKTVVATHYQSGVPVRKMVVATHCWASSANSHYLLPLFVRISTRPGFLLPDANMRLLGAFSYTFFLYNLGIVLVMQ